MYGSAVVEHLTTMTGARLCAWAEDRGEAVLPPYSPGYSEWDVAEQPRLLDLIRHTRRHAIPGALEVLESGMLRPKKSQLTVFGLTRHTERVRRLDALIPCQNCSFTPCQYRRAPYLRAPEHSQPEVSTGIDTAAVPPEPVGVFMPLSRRAAYTVNVKALQKWADERLSLHRREDGTIEALFRFEGTTCSNTGRTLLFHYHVKLGPREGGYRIREQRCGPAPDDTGHTFMCRYMNNAEHLMVAIDREKPLLGQRLDDVLTWNRPANGAGCYCEPADRKHKWALVLETIHFALARQEHNGHSAQVARLANA
jgi:hypothetical protein